MKQKVIVFAAAAFLTAGCHTNPTQKATLERGWIGGEYRRAAPRLVPKGEHSSVYVQQVYAGTPAEQAGLKPGDLILAVNDHPIADLKDFRRTVDTASAGSHAVVRVYREGQPLELPLTVGRESYQQWHAMQIGLRGSVRMDLWPNPDFSALPVASFSHSQGRVELRSPKVVLAKQAKPSAKGESGWYSNEGWDAWFLLGGCNAYKKILKQELVAAAVPQ